MRQDCTVDMPLRDRTRVAACLSRLRERIADGGLRMRVPRRALDLAQGDGPFTLGAIVARCGSVHLSGYLARSQIDLLRKRADAPTITVRVS